MPLLLATRLPAKNPSPSLLGSSAACGLGAAAVGTLESNKARKEGSWTKGKV
jgi:hypothetical protein